MHLKQRLILSLYLIITILFGLLSRSSFVPHTSFIGTYAGDTLWALAVSLGFSIVFIRTSGRTIFIISLLFSFAIEFLQLYHSPWIDTLRSYKIGALILGSGFLWSDLVCYTVGVALGTTLYIFICVRSQARPHWSSR